VLDGMGRDDLMAGHQSNHITIAYVVDDKLLDVLRAFVAQALTQNIKVLVAGDLSTVVIPEERQLSSRCRPAFLDDQ
jgi:hypothetical protein